MMNDKTRREFLKACFKIGGYAGISCLGMGAIEDARGWGILPAVVSGSGATTGIRSYSNWSEDAESTLNTTNNYIAFMESAAGDETGVGAGLSGTELVLTETGTIGAATGTPPYRHVEDDYFTPDVALVNLICNVNETWTIIIKAKNISLAASKYVFDFRDAGGEERLAVYDDASNLYLIIEQDNAGDVSCNTTFPLPQDADVVYICAWADGGVTGARVGWTKSGSGKNGQPTRISDFGANNYATNANKGAWAGETFTGGIFNFFNYNNDSFRITGDFYYILVSTECLIAN